VSVGPNLIRPFHRRVSSYVLSILPSKERASVASIYNRTALSFLGHQPPPLATIILSMLWYPCWGTWRRCGVGGLNSLLLISVPGTRCREYENLCRISERIKHTASALPQEKQRCHGPAFAVRASSSRSTPSKTRRAYRDGAATHV
jgi:hypothetical protein